MSLTIVSSNERYVYPNSCSIVFVLLAEKGNEGHLFSSDSSTEEAPQNDGKDESGERIREADLSAESPSEEAEIRGVTCVAGVGEDVSSLMQLCGRGKILTHICHL